MSKRDLHRASRACGLRDLETLGVRILKVEEIPDLTETTLILAAKACFSISNMFLHIYVGRGHLSAALEGSIGAHLEYRPRV